MLAIANQKPGALERYGITREQADRAAWTIDVNNHRLDGAAAINRVFEELGPGWSRFAAVYKLPPAAFLEEALYRWFAPRRSRFRRFGIRPECDEPGADCK